MRSALLVTLFLVAAPCVQASWSQPGGNAQRDGRANLGALDVVGQFDLMPSGFVFDASAAGVLDTGHGLLALGHKGSDCSLIEVGYDGLGAKATSTIPCPLGGHLVGFASPYALVCVAGSSLSPLLQAWTPGSAQAAWTHIPQTAVPDVLSLPAAANQDTNAWNCTSLVVDGPELFVAFASASGRNRIEAVAVGDGKARWSTPIPSSVFLNGANASALPTEALDASGAFRADAITATDTGVLVTGRLDGSQLAEAPPGAAWLDRDGKLRGAYVTSLGPGTPATTNQPALLPASRWPAAQGHLAATLIGDSLFAVNPRLGQGTLTTVGNPSLGQNLLAAPCWNRDFIVVPSEAGAFVIPLTDPSAFARWPGLTGGRIQACAVQDEAAWFLMSRDEAGPESDMLLVDIDTAHSLARIPLPLHPSDPAALAMGIVPLDNGTLLVYDGSGHAATLRATPTAAVPTLGAESEYPATSSPAVVTVDQPSASPNGTRLLLAWGDGRLEDVEPGRLSHTYAGGGDVLVRLTAVYPDNRTATIAMALHVGSSPPPPRSWIDIALAPENQNYTFTTIGITITLVGAILGAVGVHRGRHRLDRHMRALDRLHAAGRRDPFASIHDLHEFREARREDLRKGDLDDGQYTVLESAADRTLQLLRQRILGAFVGRVSDVFTHQLDVALADGALDDEEAQGLLASVDGQTSLDVDERRRLSAMVRAWNKAI